MIARRLSGRTLVVSLSGALFAALAIASFALPAAQAATVGPATQITDFTPARTEEREAGKKHSDAVNPKTGAQIAFYYAVGTGGTAPYLATQRFTADGPVGSENVVVTGSDYAFSCYQNSIAYNPTTGGWFVAYPYRDGNQIIGQLLDADGSNSGASFTVGSINRPDCSGLAINWNSNSKKFLVTFASENADDVKARFVSGNGTPLGSTFTALENSPASYCPMDTAYSGKSNTFLASVGGECVEDDANRPLVQFLSGSGDRVGSGRYLGDAAGEYSYAPSIAYNAKLDEFGVVWQERTSSFPSPYSAKINLQRIKASNGENVGAPVEIAIPENDADLVGGGNRSRVAASPSGQYYISAQLTPSSDRGAARWYSFKFSGIGNTVADSLEDIGNGVNAATRAQTLYNPVTGQFLSTFEAYECVPVFVSTSRSTRGGACSRTYNLYANGSPGNPPTPGGGPSLNKAVTPGATSLQVEVGCAGSGSCRVQLGGKLVGGSDSDKLQGKTVKIGSAGTSGTGTTARAKASRTVTLAYTNALIRQLAADGGGKIRVKAKQVGGGSRTITVTVPASVTG